MDKNVNLNWGSLLLLATGILEKTGAEWREGEGELRQMEIFFEGFGRKEERDDVVKVGGKMRRAGQDHYGLVSHTGCGVRARVGTLSEVAPDDGAPVIPMSVLGILPSPPSLPPLPSFSSQFPSSSSLTTLPCPDCTPPTAR